MLKILKYRLIIVINLLLAGFVLKASSPINPIPGGINNVTLTIHLRGVYESKISLMTTIGGNQLIKDILVKDGIKDGDSTIMIVPAEYLPGEFVLRFDYKEDMTSTPYPAEKSFIINQQDLELWVQPIFCNNPDSTWFQDDEKENKALEKFAKENMHQKEILGLLQNFLLNYDDPESKFYAEGITEYEKRREAHNKWISSQVKADRKLFVATLYNFQYVTEISWKGTPPERMHSFRDHFFDNIDFSDSLLVRTRDLKSWMDQYVNLFGEEATTNALRDSLFTLAGRTAIEKAKTGHPVVYGWMVDYFYKGYESFAIQAGIAMLAPYLDDPNCLTTKRQAILKRLEGMKTLHAGTIAPDFTYTDAAGVPTGFHEYTGTEKYKLVLFWSADCPHCYELVNKLYNWWKKDENRSRLAIFALSLDETDTEITEYRKAVPLLQGWNHVLTEGGVNSKEANSYYILATPVMILVDATTNQIVSMPESVEQLESSMK
jgi:peroxiredoxin